MPLPPSDTMTAEPIAQQITRLERALGKGPTYDQSTRAEILEGIYPEWLARGRLVLSGAAKQRCSKAIETLREMRLKLWPEIERATKGG